VKALIDGDLVVFAAGFASQKNWRRVFFDEESDPVIEFSDIRELRRWLKEHSILEEDIIIKEEQIIEPLENAINALNVMIDSIIYRAGATEYCIYLSGDNNFRKLMYTDPVYKGNRDKSHRPIYEQELKDYIISKHPHKVCDGMEADDGMGIDQRDTNTIICSTDKDLDTIPGHHYNWNSLEAPYWVTEEYAEMWFWAQMLMGDRSDNIIGIHGIGKAKALKYLKDDTWTYEELVMGKYIEEFGEDAQRMFDQNKKLLRILKEPLNE
jgi:hypothetical protein